MKKWRCIKNCGACCKFDLDNREGLTNILSKEDIKLINDMTGSDGWCKNLNKKDMSCSIYETRPYFCRVEEFSIKFKDYLKRGDQFLIDCCKQHISNIYGPYSHEMKKYKKETLKK